MAHLELLRPMKLIDLSNAGVLARVGAGSRLFSGSHAVAQQWSGAFREHPIKPDGTLYPARQDAAKKPERNLGTFTLFTGGNLKSSKKCTSALAI